MRAPCSQENLSGKDLDEQSGENWAPAGAQSSHEGDEQSGENRVTARAQTGHEGEEQPVVGQTVYSSVHHEIMVKTKNICPTLLGTPKCSIMKAHSFCQFLLHLNEI